ncbi:hypothetical protein J2Z79_001394 [Symbiobacterium terraclitae]|uniref:SipL SPOCS domain-containing protein n=1 Tax=Symbiobacterium terraclitae TaxID=557451 RepID=A0ABS4JR54_9FIRM|nr:hypothetical protein [Symbiobacterium terraclitae]MBP2017995.1 hypothetical protein [Symbiobacterium terraclitae]
MGGRHDVVCIEAKKLFDLCVQEHRVERSFRVEGISDGHDVEVDCHIDTHRISCREVSDRKCVDHHKHREQVCLAIEVPVSLRLVNRSTGKVLRRLHRKVLIPKKVVLTVPPGADVECEATGDCCCVFDHENHEIHCVFDLCITIKSKGTVEVLVPVLGDCRPRECHAVRDACRKADHW